VTRTGIEEQGGVPVGTGATDARRGRLRLDGVRKVLGGKEIVSAVDLETEPGEFLTLLGPSGCGKTTTLNMVAGHLTADGGVIEVDGRDITRVPPHRRSMGMVFQSYALFPHMTVAENVAFGLRMRGLGRAEITERVGAALAQVKLTGLENRRPSQLSGGQQQRVALARAIVIRPAVLLCDEPFGALDRKLRQAMQVEIKELQRALGLTLVFVTHDQEEALAMSDRLAVMNAGRVEQVGTPSEIYDRPRTRFVAEFIGEINLFDGRLADGRLLVADGGALPAPAAAQDGRTFALRPEKIGLVPPGTGLLDGTILEATFLGDQVLYTIGTAGGRCLHAKERNSGSGVLRARGTPVGLEWSPADGVFLEGS
jgi:spermidine/putrescine ABC transporter ATP-binding subunit